MLRFAVYTVITGDYDEVRDPLVVSEEVDYLLFTNNPNIESDVWRVIHIQSDLSDLDLSRRIKILFHEYAGEYDRTLYVDGSLHLVCDPLELLLGKNNDISTSYHSKVADPYEEAEYFTERRWSRNVVFQSQIKQYRKENMPGGRNQPQGGVIVRNNTENCRKLCEDWWKEWQKFPSRDQPGLYYALWKNDGIVSHRYMVGIFNQHSIIQKPHRKSFYNIWHFVPWGIHKDLGTAYNNHCSKVSNNNDWICIRDGDTMFLTEKWGDQLIDIVNRYPDTDLFSCYTNRLGLEYQLYNGVRSENFDLMHHKRIADMLANKHWDDCTEPIDKPTAGLLMLFQRKTWEEKPFDKGLVDKKGYIIDWKFTNSILERGGKIRLMKGVYLFHAYRIGKNVKDVKHLTA